MVSYTEDPPYCDACGREEHDLQVEICRHCYDAARYRAEEAEKKLADIRVILENYANDEHFSAWNAIGAIEELKP